MVSPLRLRYQQAEVNNCYLIKILIFNVLLFILIAIYYINLFAFASVLDRVKGFLGVMEEANKRLQVDAKVSIVYLAEPYYLLCPIHSLNL